jgi:Condensin complex subunit 2
MLPLLLRSRSYPLLYLLVNINLHKLDAAFDIDPLFHKMSKTFDEGGAKGLLLANLSVSTNGCNIVFDSSLDDESEKRSNIDEGKEAEADDVADATSASYNSHAMLNVSSLTSALGTLLAGQSLNSLTLVPQLASLRAEFFELESQGFVDQSAPVRFHLFYFDWALSTALWWSGLIDSVVCKFLIYFTSRSAMQVPEKKKLRPIDPFIWKPSKGVERLKGIWDAVPFWVYPTMTTFLNMVPTTLEVEMTTMNPWTTMV